MNFLDFLGHEKLYVSEPYRQEHLLPKQKVPRKDLKVVFENFYRSPKEKIYCHICGGHRHNNGITGEFENGERILFGSKCAKDYFGPEVARNCAYELKKRTKDAQARFGILDFRNSIEDVEKWIRSYKPLVLRCEQIWVDISNLHPEPFEELMTHLSRNDGRIVETQIEEIGGSVNRAQRFENKIILGHIRRPDGIPNLTKVSQSLSLVETFMTSVRELTPSANRQLISNIYDFYRKMTGAAETVDAVIEFSADFFSPTKLALAGEWLDRQRARRLSGAELVSRRDMVGKFTKIVGSAFPLPSITLEESLKRFKVESVVSDRASFSRKVQLGNR